jgi:hypothetical protein
MALENKSNLPSIQRIKYEDYKDAPAWFATFLITLNLFVNAVYNVINRGITYANLAVIAPFTFQFVQGTTTGFKFTNPTTLIPSNVIIGNVFVTGNVQLHPIGPVQLFWHYSNGSIFVDSILGLTAGVNYTLSVMVS